MFFGENRVALSKELLTCGKQILPFYPVFVDILFQTRSVQESSLSRNRLAQKDDEDKEENFEQEEDQLVLAGIEEWEAVYRYDLQVTDEWEG